VVVDLENEKGENSSDWTLTATGLTQARSVSQHREAAGLGP
jgi:hypothetical protein